MNETAQESSRTPKPPLGRILRRVRGLQRQLSEQVHSHFGAELEELRDTRDWMLRRIGQTSCQLTDRVLQEEVLPQRVRVRVEQVGRIFGRWASEEDGSKASCEARAAGGAESATPGRSRRSKGSRPRRRRKPAAQKVDGVADAEVGVTPPPTQEGGG